MILVILCAETIKPVSEGDKSDSCGRKFISLSSESCKSNNRRGEGGVLRTWGADFDQKGSGRGGGGEGPSI